jgi:hypothetical protein
MWRVGESIVQQRSCGIGRVLIKLVKKQWISKPSDYGWWFETEGLIKNEHRKRGGAKETES